MGSEKAVAGTERTKNPLREENKSKSALKIKTTSFGARFRRPPASPDDLGDDATDRAERSESTTHLSAAQPIFRRRGLERANDCDRERRLWAAAPRPAPRSGPRLWC